MQNKETKKRNPNPNPNPVPKKSFFKRQKSLVKDSTITF